MELNPQQYKLTTRLKKPTLFASYLFLKLPMGWIAGLRVKELSIDRCVTSVPFKRLNKNPFKSIYFAVQSMAAELSTASNCLLAIEGHSPSIAFIIVDLKATFLKKAVDRVYFTCEDGRRAFEAVERCIDSGKAETASFKTVGKMADGTVVAEFEFTWSFKQRSS
ncbi:MAG: thioesterase [Cyclobacteriaceae bacterium]